MNDDSEDLNTIGEYNSGMNEDNDYNNNGLIENIDLLLKSQ